MASPRCGWKDDMTQLLTTILGVYSVELFAKLFAVGQARGWSQRLATGLAAVCCLYLLWMAMGLMTAGHLMWAAGVAVAAFVTLFMD